MFSDTNESETNNLKDCRKNMRKTLSQSYCMKNYKLRFSAYADWIGYMRVSSDSDRQNTDLQRDALLAEGVDIRNLFEDRASGAKDDRPRLTQALKFVRLGTYLLFGNWIDSTALCPICSPL